MKVSEKMKDVLERALKTFVQATVADLLANITVLEAALNGVSNIEKLLISLGVGAVAAGISAVWNSVISPIVIANEGKIEYEVEKIEEQAPEFVKGFMELTGVDLSDMTVGALQKIVVAVDAKVNGNLKTDMIEAILKKVEEIENKRDAAKEVNPANIEE